MAPTTSYFRPFNGETPWTQNTQFMCPRYDGGYSLSLSSGFHLCLEPTWLEAVYQGRQSFIAIMALLLTAFGVFIVYA